MPAEVMEKLCVTWVFGDLPACVNKRDAIRGNFQVSLSCPSSQTLTGHFHDSSQELTRTRHGPRAFVVAFLFLSPHHPHWHLPPMPSLQGSSLQLLSPYTVSQGVWGTSSPSATLGRSRLVHSQERPFCGPRGQPGITVVMVVDHQPLSLGPALELPSSSLACLWKPLPPSSADRAKQSKPSCRETPRGAARWFFRNGAAYSFQVPREAQELGCAGPGAAHTAAGTPGEKGTVSGPDLGAVSVP